MVVPMFLRCQHLEQRQLRTKRGTGSKRALRTPLVDIYKGAPIRGQKTPPLTLFWPPYGAKSCSGSYFWPPHGADIFYLGAKEVVLAFVLLAPIRGQ